MRFFIQTMTQRLRGKFTSSQNEGKPSATPSSAAAAPEAEQEETPVMRRKAIVKSRPEHLARRNYVLLDNAKEIDALFFRLRDGLLKTLGIELSSRRIPVGNRIRAEIGTLPGQRPYLFLDPWEESGWLVEKTSTGFLIAPADKIVERETFMRGNAWDIVNVFKPDNDEGLYRLSSQRCGDKLMSMALYQDYLVNELKLTEYISHHRMG